MKNKSIASFMIKIVMMPLLFTISCVNEISEDPVDIPGEIPIRLSTQILCNHTRAINNEFQEKDAIGLYVLTQLSTINQKRYIDNASPNTYRPKFCKQTLALRLYDRYKQ